MDRLGIGEGAGLPHPAPRQENDRGIAHPPLAGNEPRAETDAVGRVEPRVLVSYAAELPRIGRVAPLDPVRGEGGD